MRLISLVAALITITSGASAHTLQQGQSLPELAITDKGRILLNGGDFSYAPFNTSELTGEVRLIQHFAGRTSAKAINQAMIDAVKAAELPHDKYQTVTVINVDDAIWGTGAFVVSSAKDGKAEFPFSDVVLDEEGVMRSSFELESESSAIIVIDQSGKIRFVKDGKLSDDEISQVIHLLKQLLQS